MAKPAIGTSSESDSIQPVVTNEVAADLVASPTVTIGAGKLAMWLVLRIGEPGRDRGVLERTARFQSERPPAAALVDQPRGFPLTVQRVAGHQNACQLEQTL
jgi:hypothetical protein